MENEGVPQPVALGFGVIVVSPGGFHITPEILRAAHLEHEPLLTYRVDQVSGKILIEKAETVS